MKQDTKDWIQYSTAIALIVSAIIIAFVAFLLTNEIASGVLIYIAQCLVYAGGIFGTSIYFHSKIVEFEANIDNKLSALATKPRRKKAVADS
jgi:fatty-acid desaturase